MAAVLRVIWLAQFVLKIHSVYLKHSRKNVYQGHRRFLRINHPYRRAKTEFNGCQEFDVKPKPLVGTEILQNTINFNYVYGKKKRKYSAC